MSVVVSTDKATDGIIYATDWNQLIADIKAVEESAPPIASVIMWAGASADVPDGYLLCNGASILRASYPDLFTLLGTTFGSADGTHFTLPDLRDKFVIGAGGSYSRGASGGNATANIEHSHTIPSHAHTLSNHSHDQGDLIAQIDFDSGGLYYNNIASSASWTADVRNTYSQGEGAVSSSRSQAVDVTGNVGSGGSGNTGNYSGVSGNGGSTSLSILPPYLGLYYIIKAIAP